MNLQQFKDELNGIERDANREWHSQDQEEKDLEISELRVAFLALREHALGFGDLFEHTEPPTDEALLMVFAFLVLP